jgi:hypothetical protein
MKYINNYLILLVVALFGSCTQIIEIDISDSEPQIVIEGSVGNNGDSSHIYITKSVNIYETSQFPIVTSALVILSDDLGNRDTIPETSPGLYSSLNFTGEIGRSYFLQVETEGKVLNSTSKIPAQVNFDSLLINRITDFGLGEIDSILIFEVIACFNDPANEKNYYRFVEFVNGRRSNRIFISDDRLTNGTNMRVTLRRFTEKYEAGDTVTFEMQCIDKPVYDYFNSFSNSSSSSAPANPYTNIEGSKLGYFSAHTVQRLTKVVVP